MKSEKHISKPKALLFWIIGIFLILLIILIPAELLTRAFSESTPYYKKAALDDQLGWRTKSFYKAEYEARIKGGGSYKVVYQTDSLGFRPFGDLNSTKQRIFTLGDSYTQAVEANNGKTYADFLADSLDLELFSYGQAGYGTYQQYLFLEEHIDLLDPDIVILQVCDNDFIDNYAPLEMLSSYKVGEERPYLLPNGKAVFRRPYPLWQRINDKSKFLKLIRKKFQTSFDASKSAQYYINEQGLDYEPYKVSWDITKDCMAKIKNLTEAKGIPLVVLIASHFEPYATDMHSLCKPHNIPCLSGPANYVKQQEQSNPAVRTADGYHWTELGHEMIAVQMQDTIRSILRTQQN